MTINGGAPVQPCPSWCAGGDDLPDVPEDGFWHYGAPVTFTVTHGREAIIAPEPLEIAIKAWVPDQAARPEPALIGLSLSREEGPSLTPAEARHLAGILLRLSDQAGHAQQPRAADGLPRLA